MISKGYEQKGDLTRDCLPDVIRRIYLERRSGSLRLVQDHIRKEIFFELGAMVFASSNQREERIGETMVRHGTLSKENFELVQSHMGRGKRFGKLLVELDLISERDLIANVTIQILDIIYSVFNWTTGSYEFIEVEKTVSDDLRLDLSTASIILEGVRRIDDIDVVERGLGDLNRLVGPSRNPLLRLQTLSLKPMERQIIEIAREPVSIFRLLVSVKSAGEAILRAVYGLCSAGVLERYAPAVLNRHSGKLEVPAELRQAVAQEQMAPVVTTRITGTHKVDEMAMRRRIDLIKMRIAKGDPYELLGVGHDVSREELHSAYYKLARELHPDRYQQASRELRAEVDEIFAEVTRNYERLRDKISSSAALPAKAPKASISQPIAASQTSLDLIEAAKTRVDLNSASLNKAQAQLVTGSHESVEEIPPAPTRPMLPLPMPSATQLDEEEFHSKTERLEELEELEDSGTQRLELKTPASASEPYSEPPSAPQQPAPEPELVPELATVSEEAVVAEQLFIDGRNRFQAKDFAAAARCLREAVRLAPDQTRYRLLLGHVLCTNQRWHKDAEEQFRRVLEIDAENVMAHVGLGQLYTKVGLNRRAEKEFRAALKLDPENPVAQKGLQSLGKNQPPGGSTGFLTKLFTKK